MQCNVNAIGIFLDCTVHLTVCAVLKCRAVTGEGSGTEHINLESNCTAIKSAANTLCT